ncbi:uncharacterized protein MONOS_6958c2 [Monocercomonoides exilis]|uniref:uncharacterized protein n=1 Tax=Monocercomonoides exilis TaxID=2049356 RepID=UPI00355A40F2|nr:hypothetical protein MONOS_6958c1 [Monocercomonoides exilis]KAH7825240.1 hypothetical protein MONOS_6958c2 [Monocercomonoides exilis]|eukprot:MONOS_6958.1-p1 / transcript=MONOS_6958.1 / gene=MONOS_6958 / organism=Monocercomonoides_exilis_PA203 / gene_product=unspecified product / transcript_product=unspecified product / location=Mono_scaffold00229:7797-8825(-) / protein_length=343 / sequence_SO=supercontig / SO=protein_coding / is_pseudo=false
MAKIGAIVLDRVNAELVLEEVLLRNTTREDEGSIIDVIRGKEVAIKSSIMKETEFLKGTEISIKDVISFQIRNSSFFEIKRYYGNGGVMCGQVGNGKSSNIENCTFERCACEADNSIGGSILMRTCDEGKFYFEGNKIDRNIVPPGSGKGGGLHLTFETARIEYSMKNNVFSNNVAERGDDILLACQLPWITLLQSLWNGTITNETVQKRMWVQDLSDLKEDSLVNYLFPLLSSCVFVNEAGNDGQNCGLRENPCTSMDIGFDRIKEEQMIIQFEGRALVNKTINGNGKSLTIRGNENMQKMLIEEGGKFELTEGVAQTYLSFSFLHISVSCHAENLSGKQL